MMRSSAPSVSVSGRVSNCVLIMQEKAEDLRYIISVDTGIATKLIAVGIGSNVKDNELTNIASDPHSENVIKIDDLNQLDSIEDQLIGKICEGW